MTLKRQQLNEMHIVDHIPEWKRIFLKGPFWTSDKNLKMDWGLDYSIVSLSKFLVLITVLWFLKLTLK